MPTKITGIINLKPGDPINEQRARDFARAYDLISATVDEQPAGLNGMMVMNVLFAVAANALAGARLTHADFADLLEVLVRLFREAELDETETRDDP